MDTAHPGDRVDLTLTALLFEILREEWDDPTVCPLQMLPRTTHADPGQGQPPSAKR